MPLRKYVKYKQNGPVLVRGVKKIEFEAPSEKAREIVLKKFSFKKWRSHEQLLYFIPIAF